MDTLLRNAVVRRDGFTCVACGKRTKGQVHHIFPRGQGGSDMPRNLVTLCGRYHMLVSPIPITVLLDHFGIDEGELLVRKARVEVAIHTWVIGNDEVQARMHLEERAPSRRLPLPTFPPKRKVTTTVPEWKRLRSRAGMVWTAEEDASLLFDFDAGLPLEEMARWRGRGVHAVAVRLFKLGRD